MNQDHFKRQTLALFFIVSVVPALVVGAVWYVYAQDAHANMLFLDFQSFILPVIMVGLLPALILSLIFAELLARPVRRIHAAALDLAKGHYQPHFKTGQNGEFAEIGATLDQLGTTLQQTLSQANSETSLIEAERNKLRGVLNSMTDGVFALDHSGRIILFNKAASIITGRTITEVAGQLAEKVMPFRQNGELVMTRWLADRRGIEQEIGHWKSLELYRADGHSLYVDVQAVVLSNDPNGISTLVTFHDLTKSHQLEEMKIDFVALAAHELRTPLTEIKGYLDILAHEAKGLSKANHEFLDRAIVSAGQLSGLMNNLLGVSRIEHGEVNYHPVSLNYLTFIHDVNDELQPQAKQQHRHLELDLPAKLPALEADPAGLREIIVNLVQNAIAHTAPASGRITISVRQHATDLETRIIDNGTGIPHNAIPRLFTKFFRVNEMKSTTRGTGLGLYICKSIVEAHGGYIWVESVEGEGSTFGFRLPIKAIAPGAHSVDNTTNTITRGAHGWIKEHSLH